jgi:hypothetical protein
MASASGPDDECKASHVPAKIRWIYAVVQQACSKTQHISLRVAEITFMPCNRNLATFK